MLDVETPIAGFQFSLSNEHCIEIMSDETNFIDFLHDHYSAGSSTDVSQALARLQQHLDQQRKLVLNEIATVKKEEEQLKPLLQSSTVQQSLSAHEKKDSPTSMDIEQINKLPLDL